MAGEAEPAKMLLPYLQRADELQKHDLLVSYYCRLYAMERGLKIPNKERTKATNALLISLMNQLEKDKKAVKLSPDDSMYMEGFALSVFAKADKQDRAGRADLNTAKTFYAASIFMEVLHQFGEMQPDIEQKQKYSIWKAADIRKALSEGRKPVPGPPGGEGELPDGESMSWDAEMSLQKGSSNVFAEVPSLSLPSNGNMGSNLVPKDSSFPSPPPLHSYTSSSNDIDLPPAPSQSVYPSMPGHDLGPPSGSLPFNSGSQASNHLNLYAPPPGPSFDALGTGDTATPSTVGSYSHASDQSGLMSGTNYHYPWTSHDGAASIPSNYQSYSPSTPDPFRTDNQSPTSYASPSSSGPSGYPSTALQSPPAPNGPNSNARFAQVPAHQVHTPSAPGASDMSGGWTGNGMYDSSYQPSPAQVAEAHKVSRFAVSALAFDDVPTALAYLKRSLELLTSPSAAI